jgi:hypothetical protein
VKFTILSAIRYSESGEVPFVEKCKFPIYGDFAVSISSSVHPYNRQHTINNNM